MDKKSNRKFEFGRYKNVVLIVVIILVTGSIFLIQNIKQTNRQKIYVRELASMDNSERVKQKLALYPKAKELVEPNGYLNTDKITIAEQIGKNIVLIDFWTYSCINCQRTIPYINAWYEKYKDKGLLIIGVHTPEFDFEKDYNNVKRAIEKFGIKYPVVQDNEYKTWSAYKNRYWPRKYLIDIDGFIVFDHIGEGAYEETEKKIQELLEERNKVLKLDEQISKDVSKPDVESAGQIGTPEIYFSYGFSRGQMGNKEGWQPGKTVNYTASQKLEANKFYLAGNWLNNKDNMELVSNQGSILLVYFAKKVNLVAGSKTATEIVVYLDGKEHKKLVISDFDLYNVVSTQESGAHILEIDANSPGLMAYTFTFG